MEEATEQEGIDAWHWITTHEVDDVARELMGTPLLRISLDEAAQERVTELAARKAARRRGLEERRMQGQPDGNVFRSL